MDDRSRAPSHGAVTADLTRRTLLTGATAWIGAAAYARLLVTPADATPIALRDALARVANGRRIERGRVRLQLPPLSENGNTVPMSVSVESPMTQADFVRSIHVYVEKNPQPNVIAVHLGPRAGKAAFSTRIRLGDTQNVTALAELSDGTLWMDQVNVVVTLGACLEEPL